MFVVLVLVTAIQYDFFLKTVSAENLREALISVKPVVLSHTLNLLVTIVKSKRPQLMSFFKCFLFVCLFV